MSNFLALIDKYKFGLIVTLSVYMAIFIYLQMNSYKQYFSIEPFHEGSHVEIPENDIKLKAENIIVHSDHYTDVKNMSRDANDYREHAAENFSKNKTVADIEAQYKELEEQMYLDAGGDKTRDEILREMNGKKAKGTITSANNNSKPAKVGGDVVYSGNVMVDWSLRNRSPHQNKNWYVRNPGYTCGYSSSGIITVIIKVNKNGDVILAEYDASQSNGGNVCMIKQAIKYAKKSRFSYSASANKIQTGRISYTFISQ
jgi:hypothetical protein